MNIALELCVAILVSGTVASLIWLAPLHPVQLWMVPWTVCVGLYALHLLPYREMAATTAALIVAAAATFSSCSLVGERVARSLLTWRRSIAFSVDLAVPVAARWLGALTAVSLALFLAQAIYSHGLRATLITSVELRDDIQSGAFALTVKYLYVALAAAALFGSAARLASTQDERRRNLILGTLIVASTYFATGRSTIVVAGLIFVIAFALDSLSRSRLVIGGLLVALSVVIVFGVGGRLIGKTFEASELASVRSPFTDHELLSPFALPYLYATAPIAALDVQVAVGQAGTRAYGCATFDWACSMLSQAGVDARPVPRIRPFTRVPLAWNTYTALDAPILDGGLLLVPLWTAIFGLAAGLIWAFARAGFVVAAILYAVFAPAILTSSGSNNLTTPHLVGAAVLSLVALRLASAHTARSHAA